MKTFKQITAEQLLKCNVIGCANRLTQGDMMICKPCRDQRGWTNPDGIMSWVRWFFRK